MTITNVGEHADFVLCSSGAIARNAAGDAVVQRYHAARRAHGALQAARVGANVAALLREFEWLQSATVEFHLSGEYDDSGGTFQDVDLKVSDVRARPEILLPEEVSVEVAPSV